MNEKYKLNEEDIVNHPSHYNKGIEVIDFIESWDMTFNIGNIVKYVTRAKYKGNMLQDLKKAKFYLDREIERLENHEILEDENYKCEGTI